MILQSPAVNLITPINWGHPLNRGLVARWQVMPGNDAGSKWVDITKHGHNGTLTNFNEARAWVGTNRPGGWGALDLDGTNDYVEVAQTGILGTSPNGITISGWVNYGGDDNGAIYGEFNTGDNSPIIELMPLTSNRIEIQWRGDGIVGLNAIDTDYFDSFTNQWVHALFTSDRSTAKLYRNSVEVFTDSHSEPDSGTFNNSTIGARRRLGTDALNGLIDNVCIYDRALSASEVKQLYLTSRQRRDPTLNWIPMISFVRGSSLLVSSSQKRKYRHLLPI